MKVRIIFEAEFTRQEYAEVNTLEELKALCFGFERDTLAISFDAYPTEDILIEVKEDS